MSNNISCRALLAAAAAWPAETQKNRQRKREREGKCYSCKRCFVCSSGSTRTRPIIPQFKTKKRQSTYSMKSRDVGRDFLYSETVIGSVGKK